jgi:hypothetical protein
MTSHGKLRRAASEALAEVWAVVDGKIELFLACKADSDLDDIEGTYTGYLAEASYAIECLERRGFTVAPVGASE